MKLGDRDYYKKKENHTFKNWFWFCILNLWLPITLVGLALSIAEIVCFREVMQSVGEAYQEGIGTGIFISIFIPIPFLIFSLTAYKGCYKHWKYVTTGDQKYNE